ncbi:MAG: hypothetical protein J3K34DRAFT_435744 [Monoraphidium minutum]|nr:MAG: hypothetical protein J3K34DRAFT_435744 [Monoraphidium minutum]
MCCCECCTLAPPALPAASTPAAASPAAASPTAGSPAAGSPSAAPPLPRGGAADSSLRPRYWGAKVSAWAAGRGNRALPLLLLAQGPMAATPPAADPRAPAALRSAGATCCSSTECRRLAAPARHRNDHGIMFVLSCHPADTGHPGVILSAVCADRQNARERWTMSVSQTMTAYDFYN